ncbi:MAG: 16S rRNA (adenine(1518)-N(6)/adenine(1519)-N(6))-dimethyltransferase RsmA [Nitrospiraceae bacterium]
MTAPPQRPRRRLGQHFLIDQNIVRKIVAEAALRPDETVLEIGPGRGVLTRALCQEARLVIAVELDPGLHDTLRESMTDSRNLDLRRGDALEFPYESLRPATVVVSNLPYNVSTPVLFKLFDARDRIDRMVLMVQNEVAQRLIAKPGGRDYGILSVLTQYWTEPSLAFRVSPTCFRPRPAVSSAVVTLMMRKHPALPVRDEASFVKTVRAAFAHRRKTVANSLRDEGLTADAVSSALRYTGIEPSRRAETLSLPEFAALADALATTDLSW